MGRRHIGTQFRQVLEKLQNSRSERWKLLPEQATAVRGQSSCLLFGSTCN